jgi:hypothetical protein
MQFLMFFLLILLSFPVAAAEQKNNDCTLKNTEFCGTWSDNQGFKFVITGQKILTDVTEEQCEITEEGHFEDGRPFSALRCLEISNSLTEKQTNKEEGIVLTYFTLRIFKKHRAKHTRMYTFGKNVFSNPCFTTDPHDVCNTSELLTSKVWNGGHYGLYK